MPLFDYHCTACNHTWEELVLNDEPKTCPHCGNTSPVRLITSTGVSFRLYGEGFHRRSHKDTGDWS